MHDYKKLKVWEDSISLVSEIYKITSSFPKYELYGLVSQLNRCSVSIPSNIAEGAGRNSNGEFRHFLGNANGSIYELETQLLISMNLGYISEVQFDKLSEEIVAIRKMIYKLIKTLQ